MLKHVQANHKNITDIIPVDVVSNEIIVTGALCANSKKVNVFNCGTSCNNPLTWG